MLWAACSELSFLGCLGQHSRAAQALLAFTFLLRATKPSNLFWFQLGSGVLFQTLVLLLAQVSEEQGEKDNIYSGEGIVA